MRERAWLNRELSGQPRYCTESMRILRSGSFESLSKVVAPPLRQRRDPQKAADRLDVGLVVHLFRVQSGEFRDGDTVRIRMNQFHVIARAHFSRARDRQIKSRAPAGEESLDHVVRLKLDAEFIAGQSG